MRSFHSASNSAKLYLVAKYWAVISVVIFVFWARQHFWNKTVKSKVEPRRSNSQIVYRSELIETLGSNHNIKMHPSGFWSGTDAKQYHAHNHASGLSKRLVTFFKREGTKSVIDFGGGNGHQVKNLIQNGIFASCYDGNPDAQEVSDGICGTVDLTLPLNLAQYDWVLSLSVGRQIPPKYEQDFLTNIDRVNKKGVVIYWGDGRQVHGSWNKSVRDNTQVIQNFTKLGYTNDKIAQNYLRGHAPPKNYSVLVFRKNKVKMTHVTPGQGQGQHKKPLINLAVVSCGPDKLEEAVTMIKSAIMFSHGSKLQLYAFTDSETLPKLNQYMEFLRKDSIEASQGFEFNYELKLASFPKEMDGMPSWVTMFKPCSLQRLFLPSVLPNVNSVLYMDADTMILSNLTHMWNRFHYMNSSQFIALSPAGELPAESWFTKNNIPHYGDRGLNCGIALMNLTKMREAKFEERIYEIRERFEYLRPNNTGDQFLQNILYSEHPEFVYVLPCDWNLRYVHCTCGLHRVCGACTSGIRNGVAVIHGTNNAFTDRNRLPIFRHIYEYFKAYSFKTDNLISLTEKLRNQFQFEENRCSFNSSKKFYERMTSYIKKITD